MEWQVDASEGRRVVELDGMGSSWASHYVRPGVRQLSR